MIYLINPAAKDREMRRKSLDSLTHALRVGDGIGALGVVVHPGALKDDTRTNARKRAINLIKEALARSERCPIIYENTAGSPQLLGRDFDETAELIEKTGGPKRLGLCIDSCHLYATGYDIRTPEGVEHTGRRDRRQGRPEAAQAAARERRDRPAAAPTATAMRRSARARSAARAFGPSSASRAFRACPAVLEGPGSTGTTLARKDVQLIRRLWRERDPEVLRSALRLPAVEVSTRAYGFGGDLARVVA